MKRAKIMLTALTVLAVVGGALAFKAQNAFAGNLRCTDTPGVPCFEYTYTTTDIGIEKFCTLKTAPAAVICDQLYTVEFDQ